MLLLFLIRHNKRFEFLYILILGFIQQYYTMFYILLGICIVILPSCAFDYKAVSSLYISFNRFSYLVFLYDGPTIALLQHVFCCVLRPAMTPMQKGIGAVVATYGFCKSDLGKLFIGNLNKGFQAGLNEHTAKLAFAANDSSLANGSQTKQQHAINTQTLLNKFYLKDPGPSSTSNFNNGLIKTETRH